MPLATKKHFLTQILRKSYPGIKRRAMKEAGLRKLHISAKTNPTQARMAVERHGLPSKLLGTEGSVAPMAIKGKPKNLMYLPPQPLPAFDPQLAHMLVRNRLSALIEEVAHAAYDTKQFRIGVKNHSREISEGFAMSFTYDHALASDHQWANDIRTRLEEVQKNGNNSVHRAGSRIALSMLKHFPNPAGRARIRKKIASTKFKTLNA